jgi:CRP-like cAMP-binding protein
MRFVPYLRDDDKVGIEKLKSLEVHFQKEEFTKGFQVLTQGQKDDHIYYIFKG